jgi:hypothetical protein
MMIDRQIAPSAQMMLPNPPDRQVFKKLRFPMTDDTPHLTQVLEG